MQKKRLRILTIVIAAFAVAAMMWGVAPLLRFVSDPEQFRAWVDSCGLWGQLAYIGMVVLQVVVALIPGEPFEIAAGYAFGAVEGTILSMLACTLGSMIVFFLVRRYGMRLAALFFPEEKLQSVKFLKTNPKREVLFLLIFMIPGTPKDLLCYYAGMTDLRTPVWLLICSFGRLPSVITSTIGGNALGTENYWFAAGVFAVALAISGIGILLYNFICNRNKEK